MVNECINDEPVKNDERASGRRWELSSLGGCRTHRTAEREKESEHGRFPTVLNLPPSYLLSQQFSFLLASHLP